MTGAVPQDRTLYSDLARSCGWRVDEDANHQSTRFEFGEMRVAVRWTPTGRIHTVTSKRSIDGLMVSVAPQHFPIRTRRDQLRTLLTSPGRTRTGATVKVCRYCRTRIYQRHGDERWLHLASDRRGCDTVAAPE